MKELRDILEAVDRHTAPGEPLALATIVGVSGSTYRREGAHLLVFADGRMVGNISGGCLEGDLAVVADQVIRTRTPRLVTYDLTADDDMVWGLGLGCNGTVEVFVEPLEPGAAAPLLLDPLRGVLDEERTVVLVAVLQGTEDVPAGTRLVGDPDAGGALPAPGAGGLALSPEADARLRRALEAALRDGHGRAAVATASGDLDLFIEVLRPAIRLIVVGAGHDAIPVVTQAAALGWRVLVADKREAYLTPDRFPGASFLQAAFGEAAGQMPIDARTAVVVMTHNYLSDREVLRGFFTRTGPPPFYLGMLGPRARTEKLFQDLRAEGVEPSADLRARLYGPVGLDVGSESPAEIAAAIVTEILAVGRARGAGFLRDRSGPIHAPTS